MRRAFNCSSDSLGFRCSSLQFGSLRNSSPIQLSSVILHWLHFNWGLGLCNGLEINPKSAERSTGDNVINIGRLPICLALGGFTFSIFPGPQQDVFGFKRIVVWVVFAWINYPIGWSKSIGIAFTCIYKWAVILPKSSLGLISYHGIVLPHIRRFYRIPLEYDNCYLRNIKNLTT